jgi:PhzF family phenazine biosynthesis protein
LDHRILISVPNPRTILRVILTSQTPLMNLHMTPIPIFQVDAFTDHAFAGNPAAVCLLSEPKDDRWMQAVAQEMNLSETAFLLEEEDGYRLRWFTPKVEVDLCGHATLASAHVLFTEKSPPATAPIHFYTNSGLLKAERKGDLIELDFPAEPAAETLPTPGLLEALGVSARYVGKNRFDFLVEVESEDVVRKTAPDFAQLATIEVRGVIVTSRAATAQYDFVSRFFAPWAGINEDPVTGSAHCCLGPYWKERLGKPRGQSCLPRSCYLTGPRTG